MAQKDTKFHPGQVWYDTKGERIQAHGGSVMYVDGVYYWYGENKEKTHGLTDVWHWGVRCYSSADLYNWEDQGLIIEPVLDDENDPLHPSSCMDRPHIIYNEETKKYVCWMKIMTKNNTQASTIMIADHILGPYEKVRENLRPLNMSAGDFDLAVAEDGKAYYYFERVHSETICADLTADYTDVTGYYSTHFPHKCPPYVREATAHFLRNYKHYLLTSGTTGYFPNPSQVAKADTWHGPFTVLGNPHPFDPSHTSFHSQISSVFKVEGKKDLFIAVADRWLPEQLFLNYEDYADCFEAIFDKKCGKAPDWEELKKKSQAESIKTGKEIRVTPDCKDNTSISDYVWLPLRFLDPCEEYPDGMVFIDWREDWSLDEFEDLD